MSGTLFDDDIEEEAGVWYAPTILSKELWKPIIVALLRIIRQPDMDRPYNLCIHGNTLVGKTTAIKALIPDLIAFELTKLKQPISETYGIIRITCDTNTTIKGIYHSFLDKLNWPYKESWNTQKLERTLGIAVIERICRLLVIDEFSQVLSHEKEGGKSAQETRRENLILKALRNIPTHTSRPLLIIGTDKILNLLAKDVETKTRFIIEEFPRFNIIEGQGRLLQNFIATLDSKLYESTGIVSKFNEDTFILEELYRQSKGKTGAIVKIYEEVVHFALAENLQELKPDLILLAVNRLRPLLEDEEDEEEDEEIPPNVWDKWEKKLLSKR